MTLFAVRVADRPPDREHPFGHGKAESISALFETLLLLATSVWIVYEAVHRLTSPHTEVSGLNLVVPRNGYQHRSGCDPFPNTAAGRQEVQLPGAGGRCTAFLNRRLVVERGDPGVGARSGGPSLSGACVSREGRQHRGTRGGGDRDLRRRRAGYAFHSGSARRRAEEWRTRPDCSAGQPDETAWPMCTRFASGHPVRIGSWICTSPWTAIPR